jgi:hypothetical protein
MYIEIVRGTGIPLAFLSHWLSSIEVHLRALLQNFREFLTIVF